MSDLVVVIRPDTPNPLRAELSRTDGVLGDVDLADIVIADTELALLRAGSPDAALRQLITSRVSSWFIPAAMRALLQPEVVARRFRIVIRPDRKVAGRLADVPFELVRWDVAAGDPLVLVANVLGLVYAPATAPTTNAPAPQLATFRVLIIRAQPDTLVVPAGIDFRTQMQGVVPAGANVEIRMLSNELGDPARRPTWKNIQAEIRAFPPAAVFYLGHGGLLDGAPDAPPSPVLFVENADGSQDELEANSLRQLFREQPVPLVALGGCLTAAAPAAQQSMAQLLVSGEGGVTVAIGMRFCIDFERALMFFEEMFRALLVDGNVDNAIKTARQRLYTDKQTDLGWAAPIVYRRITPEPLFPTLGAAPAAAIDPADDVAREQLSAMWSALATTMLATPPDLSSLLAATHAAMRARLAARGTVGLLPRPGTLMTKPGAVVTVELELAGALVGISQLAFELVLRGPGTWKGFAVAPGVPVARDATDNNKDEARKLVVVLRAQAPATTIGPGVIARADVVVGADAPNVIEVSVSAASCTPPQPLAGWIDALIVRPQ